jgi:hypothetical protein
MRKLSMTLSSRRGVLFWAVLVSACVTAAEQDDGTTIAKQSGAYAIRVEGLSVVKGCGR